MPNLSIAGARGAAEPTVSVILPAYNAAATLRQSLAPLSAMRARGEVAEIIVVDDGSDDDTAAIAGAAGVAVLHSGGRLGPGGARNVAAAQAIGDILWFVDADVVVHDAAARVLVETMRRTGAAAVLGSYDDDPPAATFCSQYKNLVHHYYHSGAGGDVGTFWAGCGAIRRQAFVDAGGFDAARYPQSSIEDIELGLRLVRRGLRIHLAPTLLATHLKVWRLGPLLHTELFRRALPWSRLIVEHGWWSGRLNMDRAERARAVLALCWLLEVGLAAASIAPWPLTLAMPGVVVAANASLLGFFRRRRGIAFAIGAVLFHQLYYLYSAAALAWCYAAGRAAAVAASFAGSGASRQSSTR